MDAIKRIDEIKSKRQASFVMRRLRQATAIEQQRDNREVQINKSLIRAPGASKLNFISFSLQSVLNLKTMRIHCFK